MKQRLTTIGAAIAVIAMATHARASEPGDLTELSLEELAEIQVTSVARGPQSLSDAAAAVFVITRADIRRSGAPNLPEVLRLAPNLQIQQVDANNYAISARGFNSFETANKLLVLVDGRSIYSTLFSGVLWDAQSLLLEDVERIEVISGPGGALYGANAVNGVINIITRTAHDTTGPAVSVGVGSDESVLSMRIGGQTGNAAWRAYLRGFDRSESDMLTGGGAGDDSQGLRGGFRADGTIMNGDAWTVQAEVFDHQGPVEAEMTGGHVSGEWRRSLSSGGQIQALAYVDASRRLNADADERIRTVNLDIQHSWTTGRHSVVWGGGVRHVENSLYAPATAPAYLDPPERGITLANVFVQDQIALSSSLTMTVGAKLEDDSFAGAEILPNLRLAWRNSGGHLLWGAVSRAARTPNRIEQDFVVPGLLVAEDFSREQVVAYEVGLRTAPHARYSLSVSAFYNDYEDLRTVTIHPDTILPLRFGNGGEGHTYGVEAWGAVEVTPNWRLSAGVATLEKSFDVKPGEIDISNLESTGDDPSYQVLLGSSSRLTESLDLDVRLRAVDELPISGVDSYVEADVRLGWRLDNGLELSVAGRNLLEDRRVEASDAARARAFGRSVFVTLRAGF